MEKNNEKKKLQKMGHFVYPRNHHLLENALPSGICGHDGVASALRGWVGQEYHSLPMSGGFNSQLPIKCLGIPIPIVFHEQEASRFKFANNF